MSKVRVLRSLLSYPNCSILLTIMCIMIGAAAASTMSAISTISGIAGTAIGVAQSQQQAAYQQQQANLQIQQQHQQAELRNQERVNQYVGEVAQRDRSVQAYENQLKYNMDAQNRATMEQQVRLNEARTKAAFKAQEIYAKSIGVKGSVLASGRTGQTVGLLAMDATRQGGMQQAEQDAMVTSAARSAAVGNQVAETQRANADSQAWSNLAIQPNHPTLEGSPGGGPLSTPSYDWF